MLQYSCILFTGDITDYIGNFPYLVAVCEVSHGLFSNLNTNKVSQDIRNKLIKIAAEHLSNLLASLHNYVYNPPIATGILPDAGLSTLPDNPGDSRF